MTSGWDKPTGHEKFLPATHNDIGYTLRKCVASQALLAGLTC